MRPGLEFKPLELEEELLVFQTSRECQVGTAPMTQTKCILFRELWGGSNISSDFSSGKATLKLGRCQRLMPMKSCTMLHIQ